MPSNPEALHLTALVITLLVGLYVPTVLSHDDGAPYCTNITPKHGSVIPQTSDPPYSVDFSPKDFKGGDIVTVTINGTSGDNFEGFAIMARKDGSNDNYGTFTVVSDTKGIVTCQRPNSTLTHNSSKKKSSLTFNWTSPMDLPPGLYFKSTILKSFRTFWTDIKTPITAGTTRTWKCSDHFKCQVSWEMDMASKTINFEFVLAVKSDRSYIALGLSEDDEMGSDSVMECLYHNNKIKGQYSYNDGKHNIKVADLNLNNEKYVDGVMTCNFTRNTIMSNSQIFDIGQKPWNLLVAAGQVKDGFVKKGHTFTTVTKGKIDFLKQGPVESEESEILTHLHGVSMIVAWVFFGSVAIFAARYSKPINRKLCKIMLWFQIHRTFMVLAMLLTIVGFVLIFIENEGEYSELQSTSAKAHPIIGIIVTILVIFNPILGYFRPGKDHPKRIYFYWVHSMVGTILMILADTAIFIGVLMHSKMEGVDRMYKAFVIEMSLFLVYKFVVGCVMEIMAYCNQDKVASFEMSTPGQNKPVESEIEKEEKVTTIMLLIHTVICLVFTIALIATLFMKP